MPDPISEFDFSSLPPDEKAEIEQQRAAYVRADPSDHFGARDTPNKQSSTEYVSRICKLRDWGDAMLKTSFIVGASISLAVIISASAQQTGVKRTPLRTIDFPAGFVTVTTISELSAGCAGRHTHTGIESGYLMDGDLTLKVEGKSDLVLKSGDSFESPPNTPHDACTKSGFKSLSTYVVEKGKPIASPAR